MVTAKKLLVVMLSFVLLIAAPLAFAQESGDTSTGTNIANGMRISPTRTELSILPGESKDFSITIKNVADVPLTLESSINDFESDGVTGTPQIIVAENRQVSTSVREFVEGLGEVQLAPDESKNVDFTVTLPTDASPGAYFGALRFTIVANGDGITGETTQVSLNASVASLLFVEVPGEIVEQLKVDKIEVCDIIVNQEVNVDPNTSPLGTGIQQNCDRGSFLFWNKPTVTSIKISNEGNGFLRPFGRVVLKKGGTEVFAYELNNAEPRGLILPNSSRIFSHQLNNIGGFGKYTVEASVSYGQGGEVIVHSSSFWYIPLYVVIVGVLLLIALVIAAVITWRKVGHRRKTRK
jgi:hypothetical protein